MAAMKTIIHQHRNHTQSLYEVFYILTAVIKWAMTDSLCRIRFLSNSFYYCLICIHYKNEQCTVNHSYGQVPGSSNFDSL